MGQDSARMSVDDHPLGPARLDVAGLLDDPDAELGRCAAQHWWGEGISPAGEPMPDRFPMQ